MEMGLPLLMAAEKRNDLLKEFLLISS